jgi:hypothetical protein
MFVEDLIQRLVGEGKYLFQTVIVPDPSWEYTFLTSVSEQIGRGNSLTEKQASLSLRIIKRYKTSLEAVFKQSIDLNNPVFAQPFRKLHAEKAISVEDKKILVKFPYDQDLIKQLQKFVEEAAPPPATNTYGNTKGYIGGWNPEAKVWQFSLREETVLWLGMNFVPLGFSVDDTFGNWFKEITSIVDNAEEHAMMAVKTQDCYTFRNDNGKIPVLQTNNVVEFLLHSKNYGVNIWDESIAQDLNSEPRSPVTLALVQGHNTIYVDSTKQPLNDFNDVLLHGGPILIVIPGGSEIKHTKKWHEHITSLGIENKNIAVMFRTPNQDNGDFNKYVKENSLNNSVDENTKVVFVSTKIPKPLVKSGIVFNTVINLGYYNNMHFSMSILLTSAPNIVYYNDKKPQGVSVCLPQN